MNKLVRYWNQNRRKILITISVIVLLLLIIQVLNQSIKNEKEKNNLNNKENINNKTNILISTDVERPNQSVFNDDKVSEETVDNNSKSIKEFINLCNEKNIEIAFNMLSSDCKSEVYNNDIEKFKNEYIEKIFNVKRSYVAELLYSGNNQYIYKILYNEGNPLETGMINNQNNYVDYITIAKENKEYKLNINNFICKNILNKAQTEQDITINVNSKNVFFDYEEYNISIINKSKEDLIKSNETRIYFLDKMEGKYNSRIYELPSYYFNVKNGRTTSFNLKVNKTFNGQNNMEYVVVENLTKLLDENNIENIQFKIKI